MLEDVGPGTTRLGELRPGDGLWIAGPFGIGFAPPRDGRRPLLVGGGVGTAPLAIWQDVARRRRAASCSASATPSTPQGAALLRGARVATDDGSAGHKGPVTDLLLAELGRDPRRRGLRVRAAADARGGARDLRRARHPRPARARVRHGLRLRRLLRLRRAHPDGYVRLCVDGRCWTPRALEPSTHDVPAASSRTRSSTRQAPLTRSPLAVRSVTPCSSDFPFAAFVTKTVTLAPRQGNPPPRLYELAGGLLNSIGLPNKGLERLPRAGPAASSPSCPCR